MQCLVSALLWLSTLFVGVYHSSTNNDQPQLAAFVVGDEESSPSSSTSIITTASPPRRTTTAAATSTTTISGLPTTLPLSDINVVVLTDVHSWIGGHGAKEGPALDADYGDVISFVQLLKEQMLYADNPGPFPGDLWFVMNGDWIDGTGLAMNGDASHLIQLLEKMPWDAVNIGNHELYHNSVIANSITNIGGFAEWFGSRYLTSNVVHSNSDSTTTAAAVTRPIGNHYRILQGHHANVLTFGFLFNMQDADTLVTVQQVQSVVQSAWFKAALNDNVNDIDAILVLAHMDVQDPLVDVILQAIRQHENGIMSDMPVQFITGHTHQRAYHACDHLCASFEAGRYLDTVGFVSFPKRENVATLLRNAEAASASASQGGGNDSEGSSTAGSSGNTGGGAYGTDTGNGGSTGVNAGNGGYGTDTAGSPSTGSNAGDTDGMDTTTGGNPPGGRILQRTTTPTAGEGDTPMAWPVDINNDSTAAAAAGEGDAVFPPMGGDDDGENTATANPNLVDPTGSGPADDAGSDPTTGSDATNPSYTPATGNTNPNTAPAPAPVAAAAPPAPVDLLFHHVFLNASKLALRETLGVSSLETEDGLELSKFINRVQTEMGLKEMVGCSPQSYYLNLGLHQPDSLWRLFRDGVVPRVFSARHPKAVLFLGKGGLRYDVFAGSVAVDEVIAVSPFNETMHVWKDLPGPVIAKLNQTLNFIPATTDGTTGSSTMQNRSIHRELPELPEYILAPAKQPFIVNNINITYDLIIDQFEAKFVQEELNKIYPDAPNSVPYPQHTTTSMWLEYFTSGNQDCDIVGGTNKGSSGHHGSYRPGGGGSGSFEATKADVKHIWMAFIAVLVVILLGAIYARQRGSQFQAAVRERQRATFDAVREYENETNNNNNADEEASGSDDDFDAEFV
jgi:2',3'-cyclic-nucleotide 2'-phosphodiesterase (5'-nucleotidase family)/Sec-independent protein translocase protein TatA